MGSEAPRLHLLMGRKESSASVGRARCYRQREKLVQVVSHGNSGHALRGVHRCHRQRADELRRREHDAGECELRVDDESGIIDVMYIHRLFASCLLMLTVRKSKAKVVYVIKKQTALSIM